MGYPSTATLVTASTVAELSSLTSDQQDALRTEAIIAVEGHAQQSFTQEGNTGSPVTKTLDGPGGDALPLPKRLASLSELAVACSSLNAAGVVLGDDHDRLTISRTGAGTTWLTRAQADIEGHRDRGFLYGQGNITISGVWGWTDAEYTAQLAAVTTALRYDMEDRAVANAHALATTVRSARGLGLDDVSQGNLNMTLGAEEPAVSARVQRVLIDLVWPAAPGGLA